MQEERGGKYQTIMKEGRKKGGARRMRLLFQPIKRNNTQIFSLRQLVVLSLTFDIAAAGELGAAVNAALSDNEQVSMFYASYIVLVFVCHIH